MKYSSTMIDKPEISEEGLFSKSIENRNLILSDFKKKIEQFLKACGPILSQYTQVNKFKEIESKDIYKKKYYIDRESFKNKNNDTGDKIFKELKDLSYKYRYKLLANGVKILGNKYLFNIIVSSDDDYKTGNKRQNPDGNLWIKGIAIKFNAEIVNSSNKDKIISQESVDGSTVSLESSTLGTKFSECLKKTVISIIKNVGNTIKEEIKNFSKELTKEILIDKITKFVMSDKFNLRKFFKTQYKDYVDTVKDVYSGFKAQNFDIVKNPEFVLLTEEEYYVLCLSKLPKLIANAETKSVIKPGYMDIPAYLVSTQDKAKIEKLSTFWKDYGTKNNVVKVVSHKGNEFKVFIYGNIEISARALKETREQLKFTLRYLIKKVN